MVVIEHTSYPIEAEAVKLVFFKPILAVREQEVEYLGLAVVEAARVPRRVFAALTTMEVQIISTVKITEPFYLIAYRMRMYKV